MNPIFRHGLGLGLRLVVSAIAIVGGIALLIERITGTITTAFGTVEQITHPEDAWIGGTIAVAGIVGLVLTTLAELRDR
ncbi:MAG TPA: hypothetical protein VJM33_11905 [Microthrixaceae bacterium]|nr:hypothetical protein [Microthrixaceae bacterium]